MSYLSEKTELATDRADTEAGVIQAAEAAHNMALILFLIFQKFWNRPVPRILAELNSDPALYVTRLQGNTALGAPANAVLDGLTEQSPILAERFPHRAPVAMPPGWAFSEQTGFTYTPPEPPAE